MIPLSRPSITESEIELVNRALRSDQLSNGPLLKEFEAKLAAVAGTKYAVAVSSGTAALHLILLALGIKPGDEVITTPYSFIASANCILYVGATPVFCDIAPGEFNIDPAAIEAKLTPRTKAILIVHVFGFPARMDAIITIAGRYGLPVIEDACEAIGARWNEKPVGCFGNAGTFAFYPNKQITTGEGGAVITDSAELAGMARSLANQGRDPGATWLSHQRLGYNYRLDELSAALGAAQLERLPGILTARAQVARWYAAELGQESLITLPDSALIPRAEASWFVYVVRFREPRLRESVARHLAGLGIETRPYFPPIHLQPYYRKRFGYTEGTFPMAESAGATGLALPFYTEISREQVKEVCDGVKSALSLPESQL
jgi:perosamine synthetase